MQLLANKKAGAFCKTAKSVNYCSVNIIAWANRITVYCPTLRSRNPALRFSPTLRYTSIRTAPIAQRIRASASGAEGRGFEPPWAHQRILSPDNGAFFLLRGGGGEPWARTREGASEKADARASAASGRARRMPGEQGRTREAGARSPPGRTRNPQGPSQGAFFIYGGEPWARTREGASPWTQSPENQRLNSQASNNTGQIPPKTQENSSDTAPLPSSPKLNRLFLRVCGADGCRSGALPYVRLVD